MVLPETKCRYNRENRGEEKKKGRTEEGKKEEKRKKGRRTHKVSFPLPCNEIFKEMLPALPALAAPPAFVYVQPAEITNRNIVITLRALSALSRQFSVLLVSSFAFI